MSDSNGNTRAKKLLQQLRHSLKTGQLNATQTNNVSEAAVVDTVQEQVVDFQSSQQHLEELPSDPLDQSIEISDDEKLSLFEAAIDDVRNDQAGYTQVNDLQTEQQQDIQSEYQMTAQALPVLAEELPDPLNPIYPSGVRGERIQVGGGIDAAAVEAASGMQTVEYEPQPEIPPEVEEYMQRVEHNQDSLPQEIVIADGNQVPPNTHVPKQPVIVLPVTPDTGEKARFKGPSFAISWLWRWTDKIVKMFPGKVVYKFTPQEQ